MAGIRAVYTGYPVYWPIRERGRARARRTTPARYTAGRRLNVGMRRRRYGWNLRSHGMGHLLPAVESSGPRGRKSCAPPTIRPMPPPPPPFTTGFCATSDCDTRNEWCKMLTRKKYNFFFIIIFDNGSIVVEQMRRSGRTPHDYCYACYGRLTEFHPETADNKTLLLVDVKTY